MKKIWLSWSSGKDSAYALSKLLNNNQYSVEGLITTVNSNAQRVAMHSTRIELLKMQAKQLDLPIEIVEIPESCSNDEYESNFTKALLKAESQNIEAVAYGDLYLEDVKLYRERMHEKLSIKAIFPIWGIPTKEVSLKIIESGIKAYITCVDTKQVSKTLIGMNYSEELLSKLPTLADPCGENGEFHTFVYDAPIFKNPIKCRTGIKKESGQFVFIDVTAE